MNRRPVRTHRSTEAPMDFEWTNRPEFTPVWSDAGTPRKRQIDEVNAPQPAFGTETPAFGSTHNQNVPFIFKPPAQPQTPSPYPWAPPPSFSPEKAFHVSEEPKDVDMSESSPTKIEADHSEKENEKGRPMALGALRRVYNQRQKSRIGKSPRLRQGSNAVGDEGSDDSSDELAPVTQNTSNHYTLNMPAPAPSPSETPYVLLGYLQFFFNLSLALLVLYLVVQFIITIQRDVEHRVAEYSQDIMQEIAMCSLQYKNNLCDANPVPAMVQQCAKWDACMNRDPAVVGRAKVSAELIAEVVNGFVEPISWKTLMFTLSSLSFLTIFVNALLSLYRSRHQPSSNVTPPNQPYPIAPGAAFPHHFTPYFSPSPASSWSRLQPDDNLETPARKRRLEGGNSEKIR